MTLASLATDGPTTLELIERVKTEVDLRLVLADRLEEARDFGRYDRARCISPEHKDGAPSALFFADGWSCTACGARGDACDVYQLFNPQLSLRSAAEALLAGDWKLEGNASAPRELRSLDQDLATRYHLALAGRPDQVAALEAYGISKDSIRRFRLGLATVKVWLDDGSFEEQERWAVPAFRGGHLQQILYRKSHDDQAGPKTQMETGAGSHLYNRDALVTADVAVFCEGWADAICFHQVGITAVTSTNGAGHFREEFAEELSNIRRLYVVGDADRAGNKMVERFLKRLPWAREITIPAPEGSKQDIRDLWTAGWRRPEFLKLLRQADIRGSWRVLSRA